MARKKATPDLSSDTYFRDEYFDATVTAGDKTREVMLPNWTTPMIRELCKALGTPVAAAQHIRAGVELVYQTSDLGDGYIEGAGYDLTNCSEEEQRINNVMTDNGRIKMISPAEQTLTPLVLTVYLLVSNKMFGDELKGSEYDQRVGKAAIMLEKWYVKHAKGALLSVPLVSQTLERVEEFLRESVEKWKAMEWYRKVPESVSASQPLQERDANTVMKEPPPKANDTKKRGSKKSSPPPPNKKNEKNDDNSVPSAADLSSIHLDGEENEEAPVFDTCDDIRKKINEALKHTKQVQLARELDELLPTSSLNSRQLGAFLKFKGPQAGAHTIAFYAAYVYFEKIRVRQDKKKTAKREKMEEKWGKVSTDFAGWQKSGSKLGGFPRTGSHNARLTCPQGERWRLDQYGEVQIYGQPRGGAIMRKRPSKK